eukprot:950651_1
MHCKGKFKKEVTLWIEEGAIELIARAPPIMAQQYKQTVYMYSYAHMLPIRNIHRKSIGCIERATVNKDAMENVLEIGSLADDRIPETKRKAIKLEANMQEEYVIDSSEKQQHTQRR